MSLKNAEGLPKTGDPPRAPPKAMSSRLLTMKFMQRATNSALSKSTGSPSSTTASPAPITLSTATGMTTTDEPSPSLAKIKSISNKKARRDHAALLAALAEEEKLRQDAIRRRAEATGDSMWELAIDSRGQKDGLGSGFGRVQVVGYADVVGGDEDEEEEGEEPWGVEKMKLGSSNKTTQSSQQKHEPESESESDSASSTSSQSKPKPSTSSGRLTFGNFSRSKQAPPPDRGYDSNSDSDPDSKATKFKPKLDANPLRNAPSLLSAQSNRRSSAGIECYNCRGMGHRAADCLETMRGRKREMGGDDGGREDGEISRSKKIKRENGGVR